MVAVLGGRSAGLIGFTVARGRIVEIDAIVDPERLGRLAPAVPGD